LEEGGHVLFPDIRLNWIFNAWDIKAGIS